MNRDQLEELASLHALGLLEGEELRVFEQELASNPASRQLVAEINAAAASLALTSSQVTPPAQLRSRVLAALPDRKPSSSASPVTETARSADKIVPFRWIPWALAACLAVAAGLLTLQNSRQRGQIAALEREKDQVRVELAELTLKNSNLSTALSAAQREQILNRLQIVALQSQQATNPEAAAVVAWDPQTQQGLLKVANLPPPPAGSEYQLWVVDPRYPKPVDGGVFVTAATGEASVPFKPRSSIESVQLYAVSLERAGGVPEAEGPMVLVGK